MTSLIERLRASKCMVCDGTGWLTLLQSWFPADGFRRERCGICGGTGFSDYDDKPYAAEQRRLRNLRVRLIDGDQEKEG